MRVLVYGMAGGLYGGIESFLLNMNEHMSDDCIFDYVIIGNACIHDKRIAAKGGKIYKITSYKKNPLTFLRDSWQVAKAARKTTEVAYFNLFSMCHIVSVLLSKWMRYRVVLHAHNNNVPNKSLLYRWLHYFNRWLLGRMRCIRLTNSEASSIFMFGSQFSGEKCAELIYNAVDVPKFLFEPEIREKKRVELGICKKTVIGFAARLSLQKNPLFLLKIFTEIHKREKNAILLIVGEGEARVAIEKRINELGLKDCVKLLGHRSDLFHIYQTMDAFVFPSLFEGLGIVLIEAQASGLRCFTSAEVVPRMVQISEEILSFIPLEMPAEVWADKIVSAISAPLDRVHWNNVVLESRFHIEREAVRLEGILRNGLHL